ncbi:MAG: FxsA family protein [Deltaproteobacteria bacterium]|nr:FxsA family protein [Deltaproteobacteria bacterium]
MFVKLLFLFIVVPIIELSLLIKMGTLIGTLETVAVIVFTGVVGAWLVKMSGIQCFFRIRQQLESGQFPSEELLNGLCIVVAGAFLITPGLLTDVAGFLLLVPLSRDVVTHRLKRRLARMIEKNNPDVYIV